jgi:hypothetical protein
MVFKISGQIYEKESGRFLQGLTVRAYDKDLLYDDLLGSAVTDDEGRFEIIYTEKDFHELFEQQPDIYLSIYAPPFRHLMDTRESIRWDASRDEKFDIAIPRELLEPAHSNPSKDVVERVLNLPTEQLVIKRESGFDIPQLPGFGSAQTPGAPALLEQRQYVAVPRGGAILGLKVTPGDGVNLPGRANPMPVQPPVWDVDTEKGSISPLIPDALKPRFVPPDPRIFEARNPYPDQLVTLGASHEFYGLRFVEVIVRPLQYDPSERSFIFYPNLSYEVKFDYEAARRLAEAEARDRKSISLWRARQLAQVLDAPMIRSATELFLPQTTPLFSLIENIPHVIITDDFTWPNPAIPGGSGNSPTRSPKLGERSANPVQKNSEGKSIVDHFKDLAEWKTRRGMRSRVVTVSDIVGGKWGDFTENGFALDLQEVIRNFIKFAHKEWDTLYVLLGGDISIVPMRQFCGLGVGWMGWDATRDRDHGTSQQIEPNPPNVRGCYVFPSGTVAKIYTDTVLPDKTMPVYTQHGGVEIPFNLNASADNPGWYYTTKDDFEDKNKTSGFTSRETAELSSDGKPIPYIIIEGPNSLINDDFYWMPKERPIPTDLYYSSLVGPGYSQPGKHDFDLNGNGLYAQYHWDETLKQEEPLEVEGFNLIPDVWVGRVPAETAEEARAFVDKVLTYEKLTEADGTPVDFSYLQRMLFGADYWIRQWEDFTQHPSGDPSGGLVVGSFIHQDGSTFILRPSTWDIVFIQVDGKMIPNWRLLACFSNGAQVEIPYQEGEDEEEAHWFFASLFDNQQGSANTLVQVKGPKVEITPSTFVWEPVGIEGAAVEKNDQINQMQEFFPDFTAISRHYSDFYELDPKPPTVPLLSKRIRAGLDGGPHFVSLTGHGWIGGCCGVEISPDFKNDGRYFIVFADSCSTAEPDNVTDSLGERAVLQPKGGAVAYVGNARMGLTGIGSYYEEYFWCALHAFGRPGPAAGLRLATGNVKVIWTVFAQILYGDPEMPVWTTIPKLYQITHAPGISWGDVFEIKVRDVRSKPLAEHQVTLLGGWDNDSPVFLRMKETNSFGRATFKLPSSGSFQSFSVVVSHPNFKPYIGAVGMLEDKP